MYGLVGRVVVWKLDGERRLISLLSERLRSTMAQGNERVDILSLAGLGAELWQDIDVAAYLDQERDSWES